MTPVCHCKHPEPAGEGERAHCVKCGAYLQSALDAYDARKRREPAPHA
jgi:hypothetical protein